VTRDGSAKISMVSQRFSRRDFNCPALPWTASRLTELRDTPSAPSPEELPQCLNELFFAPSRASTRVSATRHQPTSRIVADSANGPISSRCRLDSDLVIYGCGDTLRAAEVALSRLDRHMAEEKLNLLQFTSGRPT